MSSKVSNKLYRINNPETYLWTTAKARAKKLGIAFNITKYDIVIPNFCPILGIPIVLNVGNGRSPSSPSLDRVDNSKGYIKGNICVISDRANRLKGDGTIENFEKLLEYMKTQGK